MRKGIILALAFTLPWGCKESAKDEQVATATAPAVVAAAVKTQASAVPAPAAAEPAASAAVDPTPTMTPGYMNPLTPCCATLARTGMDKHSPAYMAAAEICGKGMMGRQTLPQITGELVKALDGNPMPPECKAR